MESKHSVFVSSTWIDLQAQRRVVAETLHKMDAFSFVGMEYFGSRDLASEAASVNAVDKCSVYICIVGNRYGSGITESEYDRARRLNLPCFIYFLGTKLDETQTDDKLKAFCDRLKKSHVCSFMDTVEELSLGIATDLHNWLLSQGIDKGLEALAGDFRMRVQNFIAEYVGTSNKVVPFGGRDRELAELDAWLSSGPDSPFMLIAAEAGRGKSALLVEWAKQLQTRQDLAVLFFPISIRFRTNLSSVVFYSITTFLAKLHGDRLAIAANSPPEVWQAMMLDYLCRPLPEGRQLVVIVDGLDEAADWRVGSDLFPAQIAEHSKVLVSARQLVGDSGPESWQQRLGWDAIAGSNAVSLPLLAESAVSNILLRTGVPLDEIAANDELVGELHRLSEGDPLLVRLYVSELWSQGEMARHVSIDDLRSIEPGFENFLKRWWEDQKALWQDKHPMRERSVQAVASALACAYGPLSRDDLLEMLGKEDNISAWELDDALDPLKRFIAGDGEQQGYVFNHPRLGQYFNEQLSSSERRRYGGRFLAWGEQSIKAIASGEIRPDETSPYLVEYLATHLLASNAGIKRFAQLVSKEWLQARFAFEGTYAGFAGDLNIVIERIHNSTSTGAHEPEDSALLVRCLICTSTIEEISSSTPAEYIVAAIRTGLWPVAAAEVYAARIEQPLQRANVFASMAEASNDEARARMLDQAMKALSRVTDETGDGAFNTSFEASSLIEKRYLGILNKVDRMLPGPSFPAVLQLFQPLSESGRKTALLNVIEHAPSDLLYPMLDACSNIINEADQAGCLTALGFRYARQSLALTEAPNENRISPIQLGWLLIGAAGNLDQSEHDQAVAITAAIARDTTDLHLRARLLTELVMLKGNTDQTLFEKAIDATADVTQAYGRAQLQLRLACSEQGNSKAALVDQALTSIESIKTESFRTMALSQFAQLVNNSNVTRVISLLESIDDESALARTLAGLAGHLPEEQFDLAMGLLDEADPYFVLTEFVDAPQHLPSHWFNALLDEWQWEQEWDSTWTSKWVYGFVHSYTRVLGLDNIFEIIERDRYGSCTPLSGFAALLSGSSTDKTRIEARFREKLPTCKDQLDNEQLSYLEEILCHVSEGTLEYVIDWVQSEYFSLKDRVTSMLTPYLSREQLQKWIRTSQSLSDGYLRQAFYVASIENAPSCNTRQEHANIWHQLEHADQAYLMLQEISAAEETSTEHVNEIVNLIEHIGNHERKGFLFLELLKKLNLDEDSELWPELMRTALTVVKTNPETFEYILNHAPDAHLSDHLGKFFNLAISYNSPSIEKLARALSPNELDQAFQSLDMNQQYGLLLNTELELNFDFEDFAEKIITSNQYGSQNRVDQLLLLAEKHGYQLPWTSLLNFSAEQNLYLNTDTIVALVLNAPEPCVVENFDYVFKNLQHHAHSDQVAKLLLQKVPGQCIVNAVTDGWSSELDYPSFTNTYVEGSMGQIRSLLQWAALADDDNYSQVMTKLAEMISELDESKRSKLLAVWDGDKDADFCGYLIEHACDFTNPKHTAMAYTGLIRFASEDEAKELIAWIIDFIDEDIPRAQRTFGGKFGSELEWLVQHEQVKIATLIEMVARTNGAAKHLIAMQAIAQLQFMDDADACLLAAEQLWSTLPETLRERLENVYKSEKWHMPELSTAQSPELYEPETSGEDLGQEDTVEGSSSPDKDFIQTWFEYRELPENWRDIVSNETAIVDSGVLAKTLVAAMERYPRLDVRTRLIWQHRAIGPTHIGRSHLLANLTALMPVTRKLYGQQGIVDMMLAIDECVGSWETT